MNKGGNVVEVREGRTIGLGARKAMRFLVL
jgi:hypothetical protein